MFAKLLLAHLVGDYILQNDWMALNKKKQWLPCVVHCLLYTACICVAMQDFWWAFAALIFLSHIVIDGTGVVEWWTGLIKGRAFSRIEPMIGCCAHVDDMRTIRLIFTAIVQTVIDNTLHLLLMYWIIAERL